MELLRDTLHERANAQDRARRLFAFPFLLCVFVGVYVLTVAADDPQEGLRHTEGAIEERRAGCAPHEEEVQGQATAQGGSVEAAAHLRTDG